MSRRTTVLLLVVIIVIIVAAALQQKSWRLYDDSSSSAPSSSSPTPPLASSSRNKFPIHNRDLDPILSNSPVLERLRKMSRRKDILSLLMASPLPGAADSMVADAAGPDGGELLCTLLLMGYEECESVFSASLDVHKCISLVGFEKFDQALHPACTGTPWWDNISTSFGSPSSGLALWLHHQKQLSSSDAKKSKSSSKTWKKDKVSNWFANPSRKEKYLNSGASRVPLPQDFVRKSQIQTKTQQQQQQRYVPVSERTYAQISAVLHVKESGPAAVQSRKSVPIVLSAAGASSPKPQKPLKLHGLGFAIPSRLVRKSVPPRHTKIFSMNPALPVWCCNTKHDHELPARPDNAATQVKYKSSFDQEYTFSQVLRHSFFAFSNRRGNFDCQRHTEILASGSVIYMPDLLIRRGECAFDSCMPAYPKGLMLEALELPGVRHWSLGPQDAGGGGGAVNPLPNPVPGADAIPGGSRPFSDSNEHFLIDRKYTNVLDRPEIDFAAFDYDRYYSLAERMLNFTRHHLTCAALVAYMLRAMQYEEPKSVLLLVPEFEDYQSLAVECGFGELGINYTTNGFYGAPPTWPLWQRRVPDTPETARFSADDWTTEERVHKKPELYGAGFVWAMRVDPPPNPRISSHKEMDDRIRAGEFDLVVVANLFLKRARRWKGSVFQHMPPLRAAAETMRHDRIAFVETADYPVGVARWDGRMKEMIRNGSFVFTRELHEYDPRISKPKRN